MDVCPWCGKDATGRDLIRQALRRVRQLLVVGRLKDWKYRVLLRPGVSGDAPHAQDHRDRAPLRDQQAAASRRQDRKSTRLNSSHLVISYAVFCLKKKNTQTAERVR